MVWVGFEKHKKASRLRNLCNGAWFYAYLDIGIKGNRVNRSRRENQLVVDAEERAWECYEVRTRVTAFFVWLDWQSTCTRSSYCILKIHYQNAVYQPSLDDSIVEVRIWCPLQDHLQALAPHLRVDHRHNNRNCRSGSSSGIPTSLIDAWQIG